MPGSSDEVMNDKNAVAVNLMPQTAHHMLLASYAWADGADDFPALAFWRMHHHLSDWGWRPYSRPEPTSFLIIPDAMPEPAPTLTDTTRPDRRLAAIMASDIVGYSRRMQADEAATLAALGNLRDLTATQIERHQGRIANTAGDSIMAEFPSAVDAVSCAIILQEVLAQHSADSAELQTRIGVSMGDVIYRNGDVFGTAVNIAARLETLAQPGGIAISGAVRDDIAGKLPVAFSDLGLRELKNIAEPIRVFSLVPQIGASPAAIENADRRTRPSPEPRLSIAVLPFLNMSNDAEQEFFADGITEDLITEISRIGDSLVIARNTVFTYKGRSVDIARIGKELGVRYVLEGSVRRLGSRVRITAQLIETSTGSHLWAEKYDRDLVDLFEVQDEVVRAVAASTHTRLMINEGDIAEQATEEELDCLDACRPRPPRALSRNARKPAECRGDRTKARGARSAKYQGAPDLRFGHAQACDHGLQAGNARDDCAHRHRRARSGAACDRRMNIRCSFMAWC